jgi:hypothetical protein
MVTARIEATRATASREELASIARATPAMQDGGRATGDELVRAAREVSPGLPIVELGSWLGSGTAHLALGVLDGRGRSQIVTFDRWVARKGQRAKAAAQGVEFAEEQDTLPWVVESLRPFGVSIEFRKGDLLDASWDGRPIGLYVDDAAKDWSLFVRSLEVFAPSWIPHVTTLMMMDLHFGGVTVGEPPTAQQAFFSRFERQLRGCPRSPWRDDL